MKNSTFKIAFWVMILGLFLNVQSMAQMAVVDSVSTIFGITNTTAFAGSWMTDFGVDGWVAERGVCYSTSENPTIDDNTAPSFKSSPAVPFEPSYLEGLMPNTTYYVRAYATNSAGTSYSDQKSFKTTDNAEVMWQLSGATQFNPTINGALTAEPMYTDTVTHISGWDKNNGRDISIGEDYLKITSRGPDGDNMDSSVYFGLNVAQNADIDFTVKNINMVVCGYKTGSTTLAFAYSLDDFATQDSLGMATLNNKDMAQHSGTPSDPIKPGSGSLDDEFADMGGQFINFPTNIEVPQGKTLSVRMWVWGKHDITLLMKDFIISGEASTALAAGTATIDSVSAFVGVTNTTAFTGSWINDQNLALTERGVVYSITENPTILSNTVPAFKYSPAVAFEPAYLEGLKANTTYYVRAYGKDASGVSYSPQTSFTTANNNAEAMWQLSNATQFDAAVTGEMSADAMSIPDSAHISGWDKNNGKSISIGEDFLKIQPAGNNGGGSSGDFDSTIYFGFNVAPKSGFDLTVKNLNMVCSGYKSGGAKLAFAYSLDDFATQDSLGVATLDRDTLPQFNGTVADPIIPGSGSLDDAFAHTGGQFITVPTDILVPQGKKLSVRMYSWNKHDFTLIMKDVIITGETTESSVVILSDDANLSGIFLNPMVDLTPGFSSDVTDYTVELPAGTTSVTVGVTKSNENATVSGDGAIDVSSGTGTATIVVTAEDGTTTKTYTITFTVATSGDGVNDLSANISIYPNPATSFVNIEGLNEEASITVFNSSGKLMKNITINNAYKLDVSDYNTGVYIVKIVCNNEVYTSRFIRK